MKQSELKIGIFGGKYKNELALGLTLCSSNDGEIYLLLNIFKFFVIIGRVWQ